MSKFNIECDGALFINGKKHTIEYSPGDQLGAKTLFLRLRNAHNVSIYYAQIDEVIEMLKRGKELIEALETDTDEQN